MRRRVRRPRRRVFTRRNVTPAHADPTFEDDDEVELWQCVCAEDAKK